MTKLGHTTLHTEKNPFFKGYPAGHSVHLRSLQEVHCWVLLLHPPQTPSLPAPCRYRQELVYFEGY